MCGIIGIYDTENRDISKILYYGLYALQHRGQESSGMAVNNNGFIDYHKDLGLAHEVFSEEIINRLRGNVGVAHVKYGTNGEPNSINAEPLVVGYKKGALAISSSGKIINAEEIREKLEDEGTIFATDTDAEVVANLIARFHKDDIEMAIVNALKSIKGSYTMILMTTDRLIGVRDPYGMGPLCIGKLGKDYILSSETCALDTIGAEFFRDVEPGEMVVIKDGKIKSIKSEKIYDKKFCIFEFIYLARPDSKIDGVSVYLARREAGKLLAKASPAEADIVISAPDSGTVAAIGYAEQSGIPYAEGLIKNKYIGRTFIEPTQELREQGVRLKLNVLKENVEGKRVVLVDDSIVRGTTMRRIVGMLKSAGAKEVHLRIASPPVMDPCYFGLDTTKKNLIAVEKSIEEIRESIGADSLEYLSLKDLIKGTGEEGVYCTGCLNGIYPMDIHKN
ncbi:amidophosphoribosyltransferase [Sporanaerobacter acetigenes]|uniref:Amidophosphoribosyltransferase n=1 Tax=Sporanaerobacter acetigenes DSM 13106 TaxID=1123281 RepID=A0A1M5S4Q3_9FIRM|nr:amidophosphoribosyltransferase [Sporanaerobacter acetigenes]SHH33481.1 amidophosphoribosyltransferase [Sporanaerobacter acetigenes DSM 13106]